MKFFVSLVAVFACGVTADSPSEIENTVDDGLQNIDLSYFRNLTQLASMRADHPHAHMNVIELGEFYNYATETHTVWTKDGYILEMHRFTGNQKNPHPKGKQPVLVVHGLLCSSIDWVVTGPERGLGFILADHNYDVWLANVRGNRYSLGHNNTAIPKSEYWDFSFHEMGMYDLPAMIDHIIKTTKYEKIFYIGHSQGTTAFFIMLSERPEYNDKILTMFSLASVAYVSHITSPVFVTLSFLSPAIDAVMRLIGKYEFVPTNEFHKRFVSVFCDKHSPTQAICTNVMFLICGYSQELLDEEMLPAIMAHSPAGSSTKQFLHYSQLVKSGYFRKFDHGLWKNLQVYNGITPPSYNLNNVKVPVSLHYSVNDWLSNPKDVEILQSKLPNVIGKFRIPHDKFNHLDYMWGLNVKTLLYDKVISIMKRQEKLYQKNSFLK